MNSFHHLTKKESRLISSVCLFSVTTGCIETPFLHMSTLLLHTRVKYHSICHVGDNHWDSRPRKGSGDSKFHYRITFYCPFWIQITHCFISLASRDHYLGSLKNWKSSVPLRIQIISLLPTVCLSHTLQAEYPVKGSSICCLTLQ